MSDKVYQILYCSRNNLQGTATEIKAQIEGVLQSSRRNNAQAGVTGALFYNTVFFAQVLEGQFADVQRTFERLQLDPRHSDLVVLQSGYVTKRDFGDWSMAYAGATADFALPIGHSHKAMPSSANAEQVSIFLREVVQQQETWALPSRSSALQR